MKFLKNYSAITLEISCQSFKLFFAFTEYPYLKELLSYQNRYDAFSSSRAQKILCLFTPYLEQMIHAHQFVSELRSRGVINAADKELILKTYDTKGDIYSTMILLDRMQCRKSPQDWYYEFLDLLMKKKFEHIVKEMEPDFIDNPSAFMPKQGSNNNSYCVSRS
jgi:hypothetical protein